MTSLKLNPLTVATGLAVVALLGSLGFQQYRTLQLRETVQTNLAHFEQSQRGAPVYSETVRDGITHYQMCRPGGICTSSIHREDLQDPEPAAPTASSVGLGPVVDTAAIAQMLAAADKARLPAAGRDEELPPGGSTR